MNVWIIPRVYTPESPTIVEVIGMIAQIDLITGLHRYCAFAAKTTVCPFGSLTPISRMP